MQYYNSNQISDNEIIKKYESGQVLTDSERKRLMVLKPELRYKLEKGVYKI